MDHGAFTVWFTGMTGSGKTTLAEMLRDVLMGLGRHVEVLDSGKIRRELNPDLGFAKQDVERNVMRLAYECRMLNRNSVIAIVAAVSPYRELRNEVRTQVEAFVEVYCDASVEQLMQRDPDGLLARAQRGELCNVAGIDAPYEPPEKPEVHLQTASMTPEESLARILKTLAILEYIPKEHGGYSPEEEDMIKTHLRDLGYI